MLHPLRTGMLRGLLRGVRARVLRRLSGGLLLRAERNVTPMASPPIIAGMNEAGSPPFDVATAWAEFGARLRAWLERRVAQPADAEDLLQQVFLRMAAKPPAVGTNESLGAWLWRVARNALVDHYRRRERRRMDTLDADVPAELGDGADVSLVRGLRPMLRGLPPLYGDAVADRDQGRWQGAGLRPRASRGATNGSRSPSARVIPMCADQRRPGRAYSPAPPGRVRLPGPSTRDHLRAAS